MDLKTYLSEERGRLKALSEAINAHAPDVSRWADGKRPIPIPFGLPIEQATGGAVTRQEMFSKDVIEKVWPELLNVAERTKATDDVQPPTGGSSKRQKLAKAA